MVELYLQSCRHIAESPRGEPTGYCRGLLSIRSWVGCFVVLQMGIIAGTEAIVQRGQRTKTFALNIFDLYPGIDSACGPGSARTGRELHHVYHLFQMEVPQ
jgi:hypothetical protein